MPFIHYLQSDTEDSQMILVGNYFAQVNRQLFSVDILVYYYWSNGCFSLSINYIM